MKMSASRKTLILGLGFALLASGAIFLAVIWQGRSFDALPASMSPSGIAATAAAIFAGLSLLTVATSAGRRMDASFRNDAAALLVIGALTNAQVLQSIRRAFPSSPRRLPNRMSLVATKDGIEMWARPGRTVYISIPWTEVERIAPGVSIGLNRTFAAISIELKDATSTILVPVLGDSSTGLVSPSREVVQNLANELGKIKYRSTAI